MKNKIHCAIKTFICLFLLSLRPDLAVAGGSIAGNGADVVVCPPGSGQGSLELLDFFELKLYDHASPSLPQGTPDEMLSGILQDLSQRSPLRAASYSDEWKQFWSRAKLESSLPDIPDSHNIFLPDGCHLKQLIIQHRTNGVPTYEVNSDLWGQLSDQQKAGAVLHELLYGEAMDAGQSTSENARAFLRFLLRDRAWLSLQYGILKEVLQLHFTRWLEVVLPAGEELMFREEELNPGTLVEGSALRGQFSVACGAHVASGVWFNHCGRFQLPFHVRIDNDRIISLDDGQTYAVDGKVLGLPFPVKDYDPNYSNFVPTVDVRIEDPYLRVWCAANHYVQLRTPPNLNRFALDISFFMDCKEAAHVGEANRIFLGGRWYDFSSFRDIYRLPGGQFLNGYVNFFRRESFSLFGQTVEASSVEFWEGWTFLHKDDNVPAPSVRILEKTCKPKTLGFSVDPQLRPLSQAKFADGEGCAVNANGVTLRVSMIEIQGTSEVVRLRNADSVTLQVHYRDFSGQWVTESTTVSQDNELVPYKPGIFEISENSGWNL